MSKSSIKTKTVLTIADMTESTELLACKRPKDGYKVTVTVSFSAARNTITQVKYVTFGFPFVFCLLPLLGTLNDTVRNTNFFVPLAAIIRENLDKRP